MVFPDIEVTFNNAKTNFIMKALRRIGVTTKLLLWIIQSGKMNNFIHNL